MDETAETIKYLMHKMIEFIEDESTMIVDDYTANVDTCNKLRFEEVQVNEQKQKKSKFNVVFDRPTYYYIPTRYEFLSENLKSDIWWTNEDYMNFRKVASFEVREFAKVFPNMDVKYYMKNLWTMIDFDSIYAQMELQEN